MGKWAAEWLISTPCTSHEPLYYPQPHLGGPSPIFEQFISASLVKLGVEDTLGSTGWVNFARISVAGDDVIGAVAELGGGRVRPMERVVVPPAGRVQ